jgi:hypothetical protein
MVLLILKKLLYFVLGVIDMVLLILKEILKGCIYFVLGEPKNRIN